MKIIEYIKKHPVLSAILTTASILVVLVAGGILLNGGENGLTILIFLAILWSGVMNIAGVLLITSLIMLGLKTEKAAFWKKMLFACLWVLMVGAGSCGGFFVILSM